MLDGTLTPKEWKEAVTTLNANTFDFNLDEDVKQTLISTFDGYPTEEAFTEAYNNDTITPFTDYEEDVKALRGLAPKKDYSKEEG
jgi:hypothetical protein